MRGSLTLLALVAVALCAPPSARAGGRLTDAETLYLGGDYDAAEGMFRAYLREHPGAETVRFRAGQSALAGRRHLDAADDFALVARGNGVLRDRARFMGGLVSYRLGDFTTAASQWDETVRSVADADIASAAQYGRVWCAIRRQSWRGAAQELDRLTRAYPASQEAATAARLRDTLRDADGLPMRSPRAAKWLSTALPGVGQVYAGRAASGVVSLGLNAGFFYFLARAAADGRWVDAAFIYVAGSRFYWGGRQNAEKFALARNARVREDFVARLAVYEF